MEAAKFRSQFLAARERASAYLRSAGTELSRFEKSAGEKLEKARQRSEDDLRKLRANSREAMALANERMAKLGSQLSVTSKEVATHLHKSQEVAAGLSRSAAYELEKTGHQALKELHELHTGLLDVIVLADKGISRAGSRLAAGPKRLAAHLARLGRAVVEKPRKLREARLARENDLQTLLASSLEAVALTDIEHRLVAANPRALELFGISEYNMRNFTIDAFLARIEIPDASWDDSGIAGPEGSPSQYKIRRLDGGLRTARCEFVAEIVPRRNLYKFLNVGPYKLSPPRFARKNAHVATALSTGESPSIPVLNETKPVKKIPRHGVRPVF